jgi:hypothetical protein
MAVNSGKFVYLPTTERRSPIARNANMRALQQKNKTKEELYAYQYNTYKIMLE